MTGTPGRGEAAPVLPPWPHLDQRPLLLVDESVLDVHEHELDVHRGLEDSCQLLSPVTEQRILTLICLRANLDSRLRTRCLHCMFTASACFHVESERRFVQYRAPILPCILLIVAGGETNIGQEQSICDLSHTWLAHAQATNYLCC